MARFYVLHEGYSPCSASSVRLLGLLKELSARQIDTNVVFFRVDENHSKAPDLPKISYRYYGTKLAKCHSRVKNLAYLYWYSYRFRKTIIEGDIVYAYGCDRLVTLLTKKRINLFQERTEHPMVRHLFGTNVHKYLIACKKLSGLFVISSSLKQYYVSNGVDENKIHTINMTVDPSRFIGLKKTVMVDRYIAYCGQPMTEKDGVDQLIRAFSLVVRAIKGIKLVIIGKMPSDIESSYLFQLGRELGIENNILFTGIVPFNNLPQTLKDSCLLALTRPNNIQAKYGFPTKLGEYLLTENPVVVTAVGDIPLFLEDNKSAYLVESDVPELIADKIIFALSHQELSREIGLRGKEVALKSFNSQIEAEKIINVIFNNTY